MDNAHAFRRRHSPGKESEEQRQRESILKVFRERIQRNQVQAAQLTGMDKESSDQNSGISRVKRRRTRAERDRLHSSTASNTAVTARKSETTKETSIDLLNMKDVKNVQSSKNISSEKKAFDRALKKGTYTNQAKSCDNIPSAITTNRLTMRLGIFNRGKASDKIHREPLVVPRGVQQKAEQDIMRILNRSDASLSEKSVGDYHMQHQGAGDGQFSHTLSDKGSYSFSKSPDDVDVVPSPVHTVQTRAPKKSPTVLPGSPDLKTIAQKLISVIKPRITFPGRRYFEETRENLRILYKQNAPTSPSPDELLQLQLEATPSGQTEPSPRTCSAKSRQPATQESSQHDAVESQMGSPSQGDAAPQAMDVQSPQPEKAQHKSQRNSVATSVTQSPTLSDQLAAGMPMDAKDLFECNEKAMALLAEKAIAAEKAQPMEAETAGPSMSDLPGDGFGWARPMGYTTNYGVSRPTFTTNEHYGMRSNGNVRSKEHVQGIRNAYSALSAGSIGHDHAYLPVSHQDQQPVPGVFGGPTSLGSAPVITEYTYKDVDGMPQMLYHPQHMQYPNLQQGTMALDLLDILDCDPGRTLQPDLQYVSHPTSRVAQPLGLCLETQSDDSPCWVPRPMAPHKPPGDSPTSPPRLYPQRLY